LRLSWSLVCDGTHFHSVISCPPLTSRLTRIFRESLAATTETAVLLYEPEAGSPWVLAPAVVRHATQAPALRVA
jgi:hypothetical protein